MNIWLVIKKELIFLSFTLRIYKILMGRIIRNNFLSIIVSDFKISIPFYVIESNDILYEIKFLIIQMTIYSMSLKIYESH